MQVSGKILKKKTHLSLLVLFVPLLLAFGLFINAANYKNKLIVVDYDGITGLVYGEFSDAKVTNEESALSALNELTDIYGFNNVYEEFRADKLTEQSGGGYIFSFDQIYEGIYVYPRGIKVSVNERFEIETISGNYLKDVQPANKIEITSEEAEKIALETQKDSSVFSTLLMVYTLDTDEPLYAYEVLTDCEGGSYFYIDALSGEVLNTISLTKDVSSTQPYDTVNIDYYGNELNQTISKYIGKNEYSLVDGYRNINIYNANNTGNYGSLVKNATGDLSTESSTQYVKACVNVYDYMTSIFDFYTKQENIGLSTYGVNGTVRTDVFGDAAALGENQVNVVVNYKNGYGENNDNAYCTPDYDLNDANNNYTTLVFFVGYKFNNFALAPDVVSHEYQHAVNNYLCSWAYQNASGALEEAMSDIFSMLFKASLRGYSMSDNKFWIMGDEIVKNPTSDNDGMRSAIEPTKYGDRDHVKNQVSFGGGSNNDYGGVHSNSTIITHAIYEAYKHSESANISVFNPQNLGTVLYWAISQSTKNSSWVQFADLVCAGVQRLDISNSEKSQLVKCFKIGFNHVGIYNDDYYQLSSIKFQLTKDFEGNTPAVIYKNPGETFVVPATDVYRADSQMVGWSESQTAIIGEDIVYVEGEEYIVPKYDMVLYPAVIRNMWRGYELSDWQGFGTQNAPYLISSAQDLASLAYRANTLALNMDTCYFKLTSDIDLAGASWIPIGLGKKNATKIYFDGQGHKITNLTINDNYTYTGLFGVLNGEINDLYIESGSIDVSASAAGGIAGLMAGESVIYNCYNEADIANRNSVNGVAGGIIGRFNQEDSAEIFIKNCYNNGKITAPVAGGIFGDVNLSYYNQDGLWYISSNNLIGNCINNGVIAGQYSGGIGGKSTNIAYVNCINTGEVKNDSLASRYYSGGIVGYLHAVSRNYQNIFSAVLGCKNTYVLTNPGYTSVGALAGFIDETYSYGLTFEKNIIKKQSAAVSAYGNTIALRKNIYGNIEDGYKASTHSIYNGDFDFDNLDYYYNTSNWSVANGLSNLDFLTEWKVNANAMPVLGGGIDSWENYRAESFDGGDGSKENPYQIKTAEQLALLSYVADSVEFFDKYYVQTADIDLKGHLWKAIPKLNGVFDGNGYYISNMLCNSSLFYNVTGHVKNVRLLNCTIARGFNAAGIAQEVSDGGIIDNCIVDGNITSLGKAGGIVCKARESSQISACINLASISAKQSGGIAYSSSSRIINSVNKGTVTNYVASTLRYVAGIVGLVDGNCEIKNLINSGAIINHGMGYASGIIAEIWAKDSTITVENCVQAGDIKSGKNDNSFALIINVSYPNTIHLSAIYKSGINPYPIDTEQYIQTKNCIESGSEIGAGDFEFNNLDYFCSRYSTNPYKLFALYNFETGYNYAFFLNYNYSLLTYEKLKRGETVTPPSSAFKPADSQGTYTFTGWGTTDFTIYSDTEFTAQFDSETKFYTLRYLDDDGTEISKETVAYNSTATLFTPYKKGYSFAGWYLDSAYTQKAGEVVITGDTVLYAKWKKGCSSACGTTTDSGWFWFMTGLVIVAAVLILKRRKLTV